MTPPSDRERILCAMFESFCVAAIRNFGRNLRRAMRNHQKYDGTGEVSVEYLIGLLSSEDVYASEQFVLDVDGLNSYCDYYLYGMTRADYIEITNKRITP